MGCFYAEWNEDIQLGKDNYWSNSVCCQRETLEGKLNISIKKLYKRPRSKDVWNDRWFDENKISTNEQTQISDVK